MKTYARIENNIVVELLDTDGDIAEMFHPDMVWVDVSSVDGIAEGWRVLGGDFVPPALPPQIEIRSHVWTAIKAERDRRIQFGGYKVGEKWYHSDTFSRTQQMGLVMLGANIPPNTPWKTMDGSFEVMTPALAAQIFAAAAASDIAIFAAAEVHKAAMEASPEPAAYDFSAGWPNRYEG